MSTDTWRTTDVARATGASYRQLESWARDGVVVPTGHRAAGMGDQHRWTRRDVVTVALIVRLLDGGVTLTRARAIVAHLAPIAEGDLHGAVLITNTAVTVVRSGADIDQSLADSDGIAQLVTIPTIEPPCR